MKISAVFIFLCAFLVFVIPESSFAVDPVGGIEEPVDPNFEPNAAKACGQLQAKASGGVTSYLEQIANVPGKNAQLVGTGITICPCAPAPGLWLERIIFCFGSAPYGLIYNITQNLVKTMMPLFTTIYGALTMLAMIVFGWKLTLGMLRDVKSETFTFLLKLGGVLTFLWQFPTIHSLILLTVQALAELPAEALNNLASICPMTGSVKPNLWAQWDCVFGHILGVSTVDPTNKFLGSPAFMGLMGLVGSYIFSLGWGTMILLASLYVLITLLFAVMRMVTTYLLAIIAVSFLSLLGLIFVPTILFKNTMPSYSIWLQITLSYMIQPMLLVLFMGIMLVAMDFAVFKGSGSLVGVISNTNPRSATAVGKAFFENPAPGKDLTKHHMPKNIEFGKVNVNPETTPANPKASPNSYDYGKMAPSLGVFGAKPAVNKDALKGKESVSMPVQMVQPDFTVMVDDLKNRPNAADPVLDEPKYKKRVFVTLLSTCMLVFVMATMLGHIPKITHDLTGSPVNNIANVKSLGEDQIKRALALAREAIKTAIDIKTGGALSKASAASGGNSGTKDLAGAMMKNLRGKA